MSEILSIFVFVNEENNIVKGIVFRHTGSHYMVKCDEHSNLIDCVVRGKFRLKASTTTNPIAVGDKVEVELQNEKKGIITAIVPRKNYIIRKATNLSREAHVIAANVDCAYLITTIAYPTNSLEFIDRFLVTCVAYEVPAKLIVNKVDLYNEEEKEALQHFKRIYESAGYEIIETSTKTRFNLDLLREDIRGKLCLFSGSSGVGKSSLINALGSSMELRVGEISSYHLKGMHTTTFYEAFELAGRGYVIDTPGIKGFGLVDVEKEEIYHFFPEIFKYADNCKFKPCTHTHEPQCAVLDAVERGLISPERYESYLKIFEEEEEKYRK
ncbi:MAG: ribosome small subunit-dependent GTPase A [Prevotellaceae bacterium]|jgi:ribosome biogenesis GTPase|nr:ribosome small subunit-dependent GTPase A [Prevotellaceae bacterium]